jgi:hypothetical protein
MKFKIIVKNADGGETWEEKYDENVQDAHAYSVRIIEQWNASLRPHEKARILVDVVLLDDSNAKHHKWFKRTDGMSVQFRGQAVDMMECAACGITGKRYGLSGRITIDSKFKKKAYQTCDTAQAERNKR